MISREEADALVSGQSGCYLVRESPNSPGSLALSIRYGEWPYGLWSSEILLNKRSVLCRQCWDTNWNMKHVVFLSDEGPALETSDFRYRQYTNIWYFDEEKLYEQYALLKSRSIPCVWIRVSKMIVFFSNYHWDYHFNANIQQFKHK